ncbi:thiol-disulfide oxidoreductase DCC family protein [Flavobacteriaceae bacterium M23B6Z8]
MAKVYQSFEEIILFDGECNLCNEFVNFVIDRDLTQRFVFTSLQSPTGISIQQSAGITPGDMDSIILYSPATNTYRKRSAAIIHIVKHFNGLWPLTKVFLFIPLFLRDGLYNLVAKNRYSFGKTSCRIPTPELRRRFL